MAHIGRPVTRRHALTPGEIVGNFCILEVLENGRDKGGGLKYLVEDLRCHHVRIAEDAPHRPFLGKFAMCGCPVVRVDDTGYRRWQWQKDGKQVVVMEHRIVMEGLIGRELLLEENVHHKNGNRADNRPENLELWNTSQPRGQRFEDKVEYAKAILALYEPTALREEA